MKTEKLRNSICDLLRRKLGVKLERHAEGEDFYLQPEDSAAVDTFFDKDVSAEKLFRANSVTVVRELRTVAQLVQADDKLEKTSREDEKEASEFDKQLLDCLQTVRMVAREEPPREFFTPYSNPKLCIPIFLLYLFLILVVRTGGDLYNY